MDRDSKRTQPIPRLWLCPKASYWRLFALLAGAWILASCGGGFSLQAQNMVPPVPLPLDRITDPRLDSKTNRPVATQPLAQPSRPPINPFSPVRFLVKPKPRLAPGALEQFHAAQRSTVLRRFEGLASLQVVSVPHGESVMEWIARYEQSGLVEYAEPDYQVRLAANMPNDPKFSDGTLWSLNNRGQKEGTPDADIDAPEAWATVNSATNVIIAVLDTGIRPTHEDLAANLWRDPKTGFFGFNAINPQEPPLDDHGHGTHVSGILGAVGNNGLGVVGVTWRVQIMACRFVDRSGNASISDAVACFEFARANGAKIINASWGIDGIMTETGELDEFSRSLLDAVEAARRDGIIVVAAAGNEARDTDAWPFYPASFELDNVVSVAATTRIDNLYFLSNYGPQSVDLGAPGQEIDSTYHTGDSDYFVHPGGTSSAAAFVSGAMALVVARYPNENYLQTITRVLRGADPLPSLAGRCVTGGRLNLRRALGPAQGGLPILSARLTRDTGALDLQVSGDPGRTYILQESSDLKNWLPVSTNLVLPRGSFSFTNEKVANWTQRFYRAVVAP